MEKRPVHSTSAPSERRGPSAEGLRPRPDPPKNQPLEDAIATLFRFLAGNRIALYRRDFPTLIWGLQGSLAVLKGLYDDNEKPYPDNDPP